jgi:hypothetical protein
LDTLASDEVAESGFCIRDAVGRADAHLPATPCRRASEVAANDGQPEAFAGEEVAERRFCVGDARARPFRADRTCGNGRRSSEVDAENGQSEAFAAGKIAERADPALAAPSVA